MTDIFKKDIPTEWTFNMDLTLFKLLRALLDKYVDEASKFIRIEKIEDIREIRTRLDYLIKNWEKADNDSDLEEYNNFIKVTFDKLGEIVPYLWY